jgi:hypothetical protein
MGRAQEIKMAPGGAGGGGLLAAVMAVAAAGINEKPETQRQRGLLGNCGTWPPHHRKIRAKSDGPWCVLSAAGAKC